MSTANTTPTEVEASEILAVEQIARTISGVTQIGQAQRLLELAGFTAKITANRIIVNVETIAQYMSCNGKSWWQVYATDGTPPVWTVGAQVEQGNWIGAVE
jgi:hypothetical protein